MSKYALKLEQLVQTDQYGEILVTIQYDGQGPKLVSASGEGLDSELKHALDTILGLVNFTLAKQIPPSEIAEQLEVEPEDGVHLPLNDILLVIASSLKEAPNGIGEINPGLLMDIMPEMIKDFTRNAGDSLPPIGDGDKNSQNSQEEDSQQNTYQQQDNSSQDSNYKEQAPEENGDDKKNNFFGGFNRGK
jgi:hypothetical protein